MPTIGNELPAALSPAAGPLTATGVLGLRLAAFLTIRATMPFSFYEQALRQQVLQDLPDLHELIQP
jgi:hypothetical protein